MPNSFNYSGDTRAQELIEFFNLKGIPLAPQVMNALMSSIGGGSPAFKSQYGSVGRGVYANRTAGLAEKLYIDPFGGGGSSLQKSEQTFRDNVFATKYILPFYKTNLGVRDPKVQQALGAAKEMDQFVQMATGQSFINSMSGNFSNAAVAQNLATASYANFYGSGAQAQKLAENDLKFIRDQMYFRDTRSHPGENGMRNLVPVVSDMRKTGGLDINDYTSVYSTLKQANIIKGGLSDGNNVKKVQGFGEAITAARNVFGENTGTTELLQMFEEMHGDLANVNPEQIKSTMTKLTAILDVTQKGAQELISKTENIRMTASQYGGHMDVERGLEITAGSVFREAELKSKGYSGKRARDVADDEAVQQARADVSSGGLELKVLARMGVDKETLKKIAVDRREFEKLSPELRSQVNSVVNDLREGGAAAQESYMSYMSTEQKQAASEALGMGLNNAGGARFGKLLGLDANTSIALAKKLRESDAFKKKLTGAEFSAQFRADIEAFVKDNPAAAGLLAQTGKLEAAVTTRGTASNDAFIAAAYAGDPATGGTDFATAVGERTLKAEEELDAQSGKFWQKDANGKFVLDATGNKIEDKATADKVESTMQYLVGQGVDGAQAHKLSRAKSQDTKVREIAAVLKVAQASGDEGQFADAKRWAALKLGDHWGAAISSDRVMDTLSFTMGDIKDATSQAPAYMLRGGKIDVGVMKAEGEKLENDAKKRVEAPVNMTIPTKLYFGDNGVIESLARMVSEFKGNRG